MELGQVIRQRRADLGLSQAELAAAVGVDKRQIRRYEAGEQQPVLSVALAIADALHISISDLAGLPAQQRVDLSGRWWAAWQTFKDGEEFVRVQEVELRQRDLTIQLHPITRGVEAVQGGYLWRGELQLSDNQILMGSYMAEDGATRSKGNMFFVLHPHGINMTGSWTGLSYDGPILTGSGAMARSGAEAEKLVRNLMAKGG